eukprot:4994831-Pleurochrysis_carterae.AAC.1
MLLNQPKQPASGRTLLKPRLAPPPQNRTRIARTLSETPRGPPSPAEPPPESEDNDSTDDVTDCDGGGDGHDASNVDGMHSRNYDRVSGGGDGGGGGGVGDGGSGGVDVDDDDDLFEIDGGAESRYEERVHRRRMLTSRADDCLSGALKSRELIREMEQMLREAPTAGDSDDGDGDGGASAHASSAHASPGGVRAPSRKGSAPRSLCAELNTFSDEAAAPSASLSARAGAAGAAGAAGYVCGSECAHSDAAGANVVVPGSLKERRLLRCGELEAQLAPMIDDL